MRFFDNKVKDYINSWRKKVDKNKKNILLILLVAIFFIVGFIGFKDSLPENKK